MVDNMKMLASLNTLYDKEEFLFREIRKMMVEYEQVQDDIKMLEMVIPYANNRAFRKVRTL